MMAPLSHPLLQYDDSPWFPHIPECPVCGTAFKESNCIAYLSSGALRVDENGDSVDARDLRVESLFHIGFHGVSSDMSDSVDANIVADLQSDQFDLQYCSLKCLRQWLNNVVDELETILSMSRKSGC